MVKITVCDLQVIREKRWLYEEYYFGDKDERDRKNGQGENHWTGAESIEWYTGNFFRDMMHGLGDYRWRYKESEEAFVTYEGQFYANRLHGYGVMSYPDGRVFSGLYFNDVRWGPGIERYAGLKTNVGLWRGRQLARLNWRPPAQNIIPDLTTGPKGSAFVTPFRTILFKKTKILGQTNSAIELMKVCGAEPTFASENWTKLYGAYCTDLESPMCHKDAFEYNYYKKKIAMLDFEEDSNQFEDLNTPPETEEEKAFYAWNNNEMTVHMMRHSYLHEEQRSFVRLDLAKLLNGPRKKFRPAAKHELDCRKLLLSCYLGRTFDTVKLINEEYIFPDVCDLLGNTALMYATCGDQCDIIHFLVEAGASIDAYNDSCCTALGIALMRYVCLSQNVSLKGLVQLFVPPSVALKAPKLQEEPSLTAEWMIDRTTTGPATGTASGGAPTGNVGQKNSLKGMKSAKSTKSMAFQNDTSGDFKKKIDSAPKPDRDYESEDETEEELALSMMQQTYISTVNDVFEDTRLSLPAAYLFEFADLMDTLAADNPFQDAGKPVKPTKPEKSKKELKEIATERSSLSSAEKLRLLQLSQIQNTILQLLADGADPMLVRCPQPAIMLALKSGSPDLVQYIITHGADVNEKFPEFQNYAVVDMILSEPFTNENLDMLKKFLEMGANVNHFLYLPEDTDSLYAAEPQRATLLHVILARKTEPETEEIRTEILKLLVEYGCDARPFFEGFSAVDVAMMKNLDLLEVFIKGGTDLNMIINSNNETILGKLFSKEFYKATMGKDKFQILTDLLLYGADPLIECFDSDMRYRNVFEYARGILQEVNRRNRAAAAGAAGDGKSKSKSKLKAGEKGGKAGEKGGKDGDKGKSSSPPKKPDEWTEYRESLDLMTECARLLHIRWLQANLVKELIDVICIYKHRPWVMIIKEHQNRDRFSLWLSTTRCLEIWDILKGTRKKRYSDHQILKALLCIAQSYQKEGKPKMKRRSKYIMTAPEKDIIESDVGCLMKEYKIASKLAQEIEGLKNFYVKPELVPKNDYRFIVCFECALPLGTESNINCNYCQLVTFCDLKCLYSNIARLNCHPCSEKLKKRYFPISEEQSVNDYLD